MKIGCIHLTKLTNPQTNRLHHAEETHAQGSLQEFSFQYEYCLVDFANLGRGASCDCLCQRHSLRLPVCWVLLQVRDPILKKPHSWEKDCRRKMIDVIVGQVVKLCKMMVKLEAWLDRSEHAFTGIIFRKDLKTMKFSSWRCKSAYLAWILNSWTWRESTMNLSGEFCLVWEERWGIWKSTLIMDGHLRLGTLRWTF